MQMGLSPKRSKIVYLHLLCWVFFHSHYTHVDVLSFPERPLAEAPRRSSRPCKDGWAVDGPKRHFGGEGVHRRRPLEGFRDHTKQQAANNSQFGHFLVTKQRLLVKVLKDSGPSHNIGGWPPCLSIFLEFHHLGRKFLLSPFLVLAQAVDTNGDGSIDFEVRSRFSKASPPRCSRKYSV